MKAMYLCQQLPTDYETMIANLAHDLRIMARAAGVRMTKSEASVAAGLLADERGWTR